MTVQRREPTKMEGVELTDVALLLRLVFAHVLADFALQREPWVEERSRRGWMSVWLYVHSGIAASLAYVFAGLWSAYWLAPMIFLSHLLLDRWKSEKGDSTRLLVLDQLGHLAVVFLLWAVAIDLPWPNVVAWVSTVAGQPGVWVILLAYALVIWPAAIVVGKVCVRWCDCGEEVQGHGVPRVGLWIGRLERLLVLSAVLIGRFDLVGFLVLAKGVFGLGVLGREAGRQEEKCALLGTLLSFTGAVGVGLLARYCMQALP